MRRVAGLKWARMCEKPRCVPSQRKARGAKRLGLKFESDLAWAIRARFQQARHGQWFEFEDLNGHGWCQTDILIPLLDSVIVVECKLTRVDEGIRQLEELYVPVVEEVFGRPVRGIVAARHLSRMSLRSPIAETMKEAIGLAKLGVVPTFHWIGAEVLVRGEGRDGG